MKTFELSQLAEFSAKYAAPASHASVVGDPASGVRYVIDSIYAGGDADGAVQIEDSTNTAVPGYFIVFKANQPSQISGFLKSIPLAKGFKITTTGGGNHAVIIKYHPDAQGAP